MKYILIILLLLSSLVAKSTNFYVGAGGNNSNNGTSIATRWLNILKVNSSTFSSGDSILLAGGEFFAGGLIVPSNGIIISSYGVGQAILSGFTTLTGWVSVGTNLWETTPTPTLKPTCNVVTFNSVPYATGRYPNTTYLPYTSANTTTLTSPSLTAPYNSMSGAQAVIRKNRYLAEKVSITSQSGTVITYTTNKQIDNNSPQAQNGTANYGFFLQRFAASLDIQNEWYFNPTTNKMRIYSTPNPSTFTIKASYIDTVIYTGTHTNVTIANISIEGAGLYGIYMFNGSNITIKNCNFNNNTRPIYSKNGLNINISDNTMYNNFEGGIVITNVGKQINILNNIVANTGQLIGMGLFWASADLNGITAFTDATTISNYVNVIGNTVTVVGHMGVDVRGSNLYVRRNIISNYANQVDDAGGFYTWVARETVNTTNYVNRNLDSNFVFNGIGAPAGTSNLDLRVKGLYIDDQSLNWIIRHNTIYNIPDNCVSMNNPKNVIFQDNTLYNNKTNHSLVQKVNGAVTGNLISRNIEYQKLNSGQENWFHQNDNLARTGFTPDSFGIKASGRAMATIDTNWISNTLTNGYRAWYTAHDSSGMTFPPAWSLGKWRNPAPNGYNHDKVSVLPPIPITNTNTTLHTNPSNNLLTISFPGLRKRDPKGNIYDHSATVGRWSSLILIDDGNAPSAGNIPPIARAGADQTITLPTNSVSVSGSTSTDADGTIVAYSWTKISGSGGTLTTPNAVNTTFTGLTAGSYTLRLKVTDNIGDTAVDFVNVQVNAQPMPPVSNAGADQTITLPQNSTTVSGSASFDTDGTITTWLWTKISGPTGGIINTPNATLTTITSMIQGVYVFRLRVTDNSGLTNDDFIQITVNPVVPPQNQPPVSEAGPSQTISLPVTSVALDGSNSTDPEGGALTYFWRQISGPNNATFTNNTMAQTCVSGLIQGVYIMQLRVTDPVGDTSIDAMSITVGGGNQNPTVTASNDTTITLPANTVNLTSVGFDPEGGAVTYAWLKLSGPASGTITTPNSQNTSVTGLTEGTYIFQVTVTDNVGNTASEAVQVTVNPAIPPVNNPPVANAGINQVITLPTNSTGLSGSGSTDSDGTITAYFWTKISGPSGGTISTPNSVNTNITGLIQGTYNFKLRVTDNLGDTGIAFVQILVNAAPINLPPTVNAGNDTTITLPANSVTLTAIGTDPEGSELDYLWEKLSGPASGTIVIPNGTSTSVTGLTQGSYIFRVTVTDSLGSSGTDEVQVNVNPAPPLINPVADAGIGQTLTLPTNSTTLVGSATDQDGTIVSYGWVQISGPNSATGMPSATASQAIGGMIAGTYQFELTATDNDALTGKDTVIIIVQAAQSFLPIASAGGDITMIDTFVTVNGSGSDQAGTIVSYSWVKISGAPGDVIANPNSASTLISGLRIGVYVYEITVTDNDGNSDTDEAIITVTTPSVFLLRFYDTP